MALPLSYVVTTTVKVQGPSVTQQGFGIPIIVSHSAAWLERFRTYNQPSDVVADFAVTTPEYLAAAAIFAQSPRPPQIMIGRAALVPTMIQTVSLLATQAGAYALNAWVAGVIQKVTYTSPLSIAWAHSGVARVVGALITNDTGKLYICITAGIDANAGGPTGTAADITDGGAHWMYAGAGGVGVASNDAIVYNLAVLLTALAAPVPSFTAAATGSAGSKILTCTGSSAGNWFAIEPLDSSAGAIGGLMALAETTANPGIATDLGAIFNATKAWYGFVLLFKGALVTPAAAWAESNKRLFIVGLPDTLIATQASGVGTDEAQTLAALPYQYTGMFSHPRTYEFPDAAEIGRFFPILPGSDNWRLKALAGVSSTNYTSTQVTNLEAKHCNYYANFAGVNCVCGQGVTAAGFPYAIDVTRSVDQVVAWIGQDLASALIQAEKVPYTDAGADLLGSIVRADLARAVTAGIASAGGGGTASPLVTYPKVAAQSLSDRQNRIFPSMNASFVMAGAINAISVEIDISF